MAIASSVPWRLADANELGQILLKPDLLLLDEPANRGFRNHWWLETYLRADYLMVIVSS